MLVPCEGPALRWGWLVVLQGQVVGHEPVGFAPEAHAAGSNQKAVLVVLVVAEQCSEAAALGEFQLLTVRATPVFACRANQQLPHSQQHSTPYTTPHTHLLMRPSSSLSNIWNAMLRDCWLMGRRAKLTLAGLLAPPCCSCLLCLHKSDRFRRAAAKRLLLVTPGTSSTCA